MEHAGLKEVQPQRGCQHHAYGNDSSPAGRKAVELPYYRG